MLKGEDSTEKRKRGRPEIMCEMEYVLMEKVFGPQSKRTAQNTHYMVEISGILRAHQEEIPHLEYLIGERKGRHCALIELGRLYYMIERQYGSEPATGFLVTVTNNLCNAAASGNWTTRQMEQVIREKKLSIKAKLKGKE